VALTFKLTGADKIIDRLSKFPSKLQDAAGKRSARRAMAIVREAARQAVKALDDPASPDRIWRNVYLQQSRRQSKRVGGVVMRVGILGGANFRADAPSGTTPGGDTRHWRFIELGSENQAAQPFLQPALQSRAEQVANKLVSELNKEIDKLAAAA
jgi:HK97 gp10 family phage protein